MNRNDIIRQKQDKVARQLTRWAKRKNILKIGERLVFTLEVRQTKTPLVAAVPGNTLLELSVRDFFTAERIERAGFGSKQSRTRILNCLELESIGTVQNLVDTTARALLAMPHFSEKSLEMIKTLLAAEGLSLKKRS